MLATNKKQTKKIRRFSIRGILFIGVYFAIVWNLLIQKNIIHSWIYLLLGLFVLLFLVLDFDLFSKKQIRWGVLIFLTISFLLFFFSVETNTNTIVAFILLNLGFITLIWNKDTKIFNPWRYFTGGSYIFGLLIALAYSFFILGTTNIYSVNCEKTYGSITELTKKLQNQKEESLEAEKQEKEKIEKKSEKLLKTTEKKTLWGTFLENGKEVLSDVGLTKDKIKNTRDHILVEINEVGYGVVDSTKRLWNKINDNRRALSVSACKYLGKQILYLYTNTYFQLALVILMSFVFIGIIRFGARIITLVAYFFFKVLQILGVYQITKAEKLVDTVE